MSQPTDDPTPPDPTAGLTDPRTLHHSPELLEPDVANLETGPNEAPEVEPDGRDEFNDPAEGARGLVDPRSEIPDPTEP